MAPCESLSCRRPVAMDGGTCMAPPSGCSGRSRQSEWVAQLLHDGLGPMEPWSIAQLTRPRQHGRDLAPAHAAPSAVLGARGGAEGGWEWRTCRLCRKPTTSRLPTAQLPIRSSPTFPSLLKPPFTLTVAPCYARPRPWRRPRLTLLSLGKRWPSSAVAALESLPCGP